MTLAVHRSGKGQPLVLLHGWGMHSGIWQNLMPLLEGRYALYRVDLPGHGASHSVATTAQLDDWLDAVQAVVPSDAIWMGWSLGGLLSLAAALREPTSIKALLLITATPAFVRRDDWSVGMAPDTLNQFAAELLADTRRTLKRFLGLQLRGVAQERELLRELNRAVDALPAATPQALEDGLALLRETDLRAALPQLQVPSHWLFGDKDALVASGTAQAVRALTSNAQFTEIQGAAHAPVLSHPERVQDALYRLQAELA